MEQLADIKNVIYIGIDQSLTSTGLCINDGKCYKFKLFQTKKSEHALDIVIRAKTITKGLIADIIDTAEKFPMHEIVVCIEGLSMGKNTTSSRDLAGLQMMIISELLDVVNVTRIEIVPPKTLKKYATTSGNADKEEMFAAVEVKEKGVYDYMERTFLKSKGRYDIVDAYWLSHYCKDVLSA